MTITVNGEQRELSLKTTVRDLLNHLDIQQDRVAVEVNVEILASQDFDTRELREGDQVEILSFMGGGGHLVID